MASCRFFRSCASHASGSLPRGLPPATGMHVQQGLTGEKHNYVTGSSCYYIRALWLRNSVAILLFRGAGHRTVTRTGSFLLAGGSRHSLASVPVVGPEAGRRLLHAHYVTTQINLKVAPVPCCWRRDLHSVAANLQRRGSLGSEGLPANTSAASCTHDAVLLEAEKGPTASAKSGILCETEPSEGSYAQELLQHIREVTELDASMKEAGGVASSSGWFVDWLLALKLGLGLPWCVALPVAGCLLRLATLPIAVDSVRRQTVWRWTFDLGRLFGTWQERDRRQRQLVDPQFSRMKERMKVAYRAGNSQEYQRLRMETKAFLKKHGMGVLPTSLFQMLLLGLAISFSTPAIRGMAGASDDWKGFAVEQPGWLESLALPDASGLTAVLCWLVIVSAMAAGWMVSSKIQRRSPSSAAASGTSSPALMRKVSVVAATVFAFYSGTQLPAAALLFLVPAVGLQSVFMRIFRLPAVERGLHFVPEGLRPLQQTYVALLQRREPGLIAEWKRRGADAQPTGLVGDAAAGDAAATSEAIVQLWREVAQRGGAAAPGHLKTWAEQAADAQRQRLSNVASGRISGRPMAHGAPSKGPANRRLPWRNGAEYHGLFSSWTAA